MIAGYARWKGLKFQTIRRRMAMAGMQQPVVDSSQHHLHRPNCDFWDGS
jgi:hypothetical protein